MTRLAIRLATLSVCALVVPLVAAADAVVCTEQYAPVCGRIGSVTKTYSNTCFARADGATVIAQGPCRSDSGGKTPK